jgi:uncharacterized cupredoxin-like copper-binding protein
MTMINYRFTPSEIAARVNQPIRLNIRNVDLLLHEFTVDYSEVLVLVQPMESQNVDFVISKAGTYTFSCNLVIEGDHRALGMIGKIEVAP